MEVFYGGLWGTVGSNKWDLKDASVFCRQLGFTQAQQTYEKKVRKKGVCWFGDFDCQGSEMALGHCRHRLIARAFVGSVKSSDVFVRCGNYTGEFFL